MSHIILLMVILRSLLSFRCSGETSAKRLSTHGAQEVYQTILLKCKEKVQKKVFLKVDHLAQKPAQNGCFLQESHFITLHKYPSFVQKAT